MDRSELPAHLPPTSCQRWLPSSSEAYFCAFYSAATAQDGLTEEELILAEVPRVDSSVAARMLGAVRRAKRDPNYAAFWDTPAPESEWSGGTPPPPLWPDLCIKSSPSFLCSFLPLPELACSQCLADGRPLQRVDGRGERLSVSSIP